MLLTTTTLSLISIALPSPSTQKKNITVYYSSNARISNLINNANANWNISCYVTLNTYVTTANGDSVLNTSPVSSNLPIIQVYTNQVNTFRVIGLDNEANSTDLKYPSSCPNANWC